MTETIESTLAKVYELIEASDLEQARAILKTLLDTDRDNPDVWWLYAHSVTEPETARMALNSVLHLDPDYPQVKELLRRLNSQIATHESEDSHEPQFVQTGLAPLASNNIQGSPVPAPKDFTLEGFSVVGGGRGEGRVRPLQLLLAGLFVVVIIVGLGLVWLVNQQRQVNPTPTSVTNTDELQNPSLSDGFVSLRNAFESFTIQGDGIAEEETSLGKTVTIRICTIPGPEMRSTLLSAMDFLARNSINLEGFDAIGVQVWDCSTDTLLRFIAVSSSQSRSYVESGTDQQSFEAQWVPVG